MMKIPNYTIEEELGQGGIAVVYLAIQDMLQRHVALKIMHADMANNANFRQSFLTEGTCNKTQKLQSFTYYLFALC